jgi:hypothetical protein
MMLRKSNNYSVGAVCLAMCLSLLRVESAAAKEAERPDWNGLSAQICSDHSKATGLSPELWFPAPMVGNPSTHAVVLTSMDTSAQIIRANEQTVVPLPSGEWTGMSCLVGLALVRARKALRKMFV